MSAEPTRGLAIAPIESALCQAPGNGGWANKLLFRATFQADQKLAQQTPRPEVKPFDYAVEGTSLTRRKKLCYLKIWAR